MYFCGFIIGFFTMGNFINTILVSARLCLVFNIYLSLAVLDCC